MCWLLLNERPMQNMRTMNRHVYEIRTTMSQNHQFKYGLTIRSKSQTQKKTTSTPTISFFSDDNDDGVESEIIREGLKKRAKKEVAQQHAEAISQDASIFDYDGVYDELKQSQTRPKVQEQTARQPKYIGALLEKAKVRKIEQEIVFERNLIKERKKEDHLFGDKEKFVTKAYKQKLAEQAKWLEEEKKLAAVEAANDVTKRDDLSDFYRTMLDRTAKVLPPPQDISKGKLMDKAEDSGKIGSIDKNLEPARKDITYLSKVDHVQAEENIRVEAEPKEDVKDMKEKELQSGGREEKGETEGKEENNIEERKAVSAAEKAAAAKERYLARKRNRGLEK